MEGRSECLLAMLRGVGCNINYLPEWGFKIKFSGGEKCPGGEKNNKKRYALLSSINSNFSLSKQTLMDRRQVGGNGRSPANTCHGA